MRIFKQDFIKKVTDVLGENDIKKRMSVPNTNLTVTDEEGNSKKFAVKIPDRYMLYNHKDVQNIVDACLAVMEDCLKRGDELTMYGIGTLGLKYRAPRMVKIPLTEEWTQVPEHYVPHMKFGNTLMSAARFYEASLRESQISVPEPIYDIGDKELDFDLFEDDDDG